MTTADAAALWRAPFSPLALFFASRAARQRALKRMEERRFTPRAITTITTITTITIGGMDSIITGRAIILGIDIMRGHRTAY